MASTVLQTRSLWSTAPPEPRTRLENWPTLLYSWWATVFAAVVILTRLMGRKIRSNRLFREDWIMFLALIPLFVRMAFIHVVLVYGTNNVATEGITYTDLQLEHRKLGARLVLAARIWYAIFIWMSKWAVSEFLKRITIQIWRPSYEKVLHGIRIFLVATLVAVIVATLAECQPFDHYWQVVPDPGPQCRQGFAQLITMGTADIITDILLVVFPIPIVLRSGQTWRRKIQVSALFSTSIVLMIITGMRMPEVIEKHGRQQYRTVWASSEILASAFVSNFVIIGSFLRDKGTKRNRYKSTSVSDSIDRASVRRQNTLQIHNYGSDDDLFRDLGCRVPEHLRDEPSNSVRLAPMALPAMSSPFANREAPEGSRRPSAMKANSDTDSLNKQAPADGQPLPSPTPSQVTTKKNVSFFDVGGLLEDSPPSPSTTRSRSTTILSSGNSHTIAYDFAPATPSQSRRGSRAFMSDMGGILTPSSSRTDSRAGGESSIVGGNGHPRRGSLPGGRLRNGAPIGVLGPMLERQETQLSLQDAGGLLSGPPTPALPTTSPPAPVSSPAPPSSSPAPRPGPSRAPPSGIQSPRLDRTTSEQSLADVGGLLGSGPRGQWMTRSGQSSAVAASSAADKGKGKSWEEMDLHDPGGLLR